MQNFDNLFSGFGRTPFEALLVPGALLGLISRDVAQIEAVARGDLVAALTLN